MKIEWTDAERGDLAKMGIKKPPETVDVRDIKLIWALDNIVMLELRCIPYGLKVEFNAPGNPDK